MENAVTEKKRYTPLIRTVAGVLVVSILLGLSANGFIRVRIQQGDESQAATNYLVENTDYVTGGARERFQEKLQTLVRPTELEDYYRLAGTQIAEENYTAALESIEACISLDLKNDPVLTQDLLMKKGCLMVLLEQYDEALNVLHDVKELSPDYGEVYLVMAQIYAQQGRSSQLAEMLEQYLSLVPEDSQIRMVLAQTYFSLEQFEEAGQAYRTLLEEPDSLENLSQIHYLHALTQIQLEEFTGAEKSLLAAAAQSPELEGLYYYLGVCQMAREGYQEAVESLTKSIESGSMVQLSLYSRGVCGLVLEDYDLILAVEDLQAAADYAEVDMDSSISQQARILIEQLTVEDSTS